MRICHKRTLANVSQLNTNTHSTQIKTQHAHIHTLSHKISQLSPQRPSATRNASQTFLPLPFPSHSPTTTRRTTFYHFTLLCPLYSLSVSSCVFMCVVCCCCGVWIGEVPPHSHNEVLTKNTYYSAPLEEALLHFTLTPQCLFPFYFCSWVYKVDAAGLGDSSFFPYTPDCVWVTVWVCVCVSVVYYSKMYECFHPAPRTLRGGQKKVGKVTLYPSVKELGMRGALLILDPGFSHNKTRQRRRKRRRQQQKCRQRQKHCAEDQRRCWRRIAILMQNAWEIGKNQGGEMRCEETKNGAERYV